MTVTANRWIDLDPGIGQIHVAYRFQLVDHILNHVAWVKPLRAQSVTASTGSTIDRQLTGVTFDEATWTDIDRYRERLRLWMVTPDGTRWPMGVFVFSQPSVTRTRTDINTVSLLDQGFILNQGTTAPFGLPPGGSVGAGLARLFDQTNLPIRVTPLSDQVVVGDPPNWPAGTSRLVIAKDLCKLAGWLPPHFDNEGLLTVRMPPTAATEPDHIYTTRRMNNLKGSDNTLTAPNIYQVIGTGIGSGNISATATVRSDLPWSVENRGYQVVHTERVQSLASTAHAQAMADSLAATNPGLVTWEWDSPPDPRHDLYQIVEWEGARYRETGWVLPLTPAGPMGHTVTVGGFADAV